MHFHHLIFSFLKIEKELITRKNSSKFIDFASNKLNVTKLLTDEKTLDENVHQATFKNFRVTPSF